VADDWRDEILTLPSGRTRVRVRGDGPTFVWAHGLLSPIAVEDASPEAQLFAALPDWRVVRYDARGHGRSEAGASEEQHRWDRLGADLLDLASTLGAERFVAGGASMGAATALHAAVRAPERILGLVLVLPPTAWETRPAQAQQYLAMARLLEARGVEGFVRLAAPAMATAPIPPAVRDALLENLRHWDAVALQRVLLGAAASDLPSVESLATLRIPTLLLPTPGDPGHPLSTAERIADAIPGARLEPLPAGASSAPAERVRPFLASLRPRTAKP
jgi:pimeloyl-ACP methyl ester carboxylesterase